MAKNIFYVVFAAWLLSLTACSQNAESIQACYSEDFSRNDKVLTSMINKPHFRGGRNSFNDFLTSNISIESFTGGLWRNRQLYKDTARMKFIVNKQGGISNLSVTLAKKKRFADEITRVIKKSSCNWVAGSTDQPADGWIQYDLYFQAEQFNNEVKTTMTLNELVPAD